MYTNTFEISLLQLSKCANELSEQAQHLETLMNICYQDYTNSKLGDSKMITNEIIEPMCDKLPDQLVKFQEMKKNKSVEGENIINEENIEKIDKSVSSSRIIVEEKSNINIKIQENEIKIENPDQYSGIKRLSPEKDQKEGAMPIPKINPKKSTKYPKKQNLNNNSRTDTKNIQSQKHEAVFSLLTTESKERIVYDKIELGTIICQRKWGITHSMILSYIRAKNYFIQIRKE